MRDFLALFPSFYLVDNVLYWAVFGVLFRWYHTNTFLSHFLISGGVSLLLAFFIRLLQGRPVFLINGWTRKTSDDTETIQNIIIALLLLFPGLVGYYDVIELTGAPSDSERFAVGRVRSMVVIAATLVGIYACMIKWGDVLKQTASFHTRYTAASGSRTAEENSSEVLGKGLKPSWLIHLIVIMSIAILVDIFIKHPIKLDWPLAVLLTGYVVCFSLFNTIWNNGVQKGYKES